MKKLYLIIIVTFCCINKMNAQIDSSFLLALDSINLDDIFGKPPLKKSYFKFSSSYLSNYVYGGRKDTIDYPYLSASIEYNHKSGLYASAGGSYLVNQFSRWDVRNLELGYSVDSIKNFSGNIYVNKAFYNSSSNNVQSDIDWIIGANVAYSVQHFSLSFSPSVFLGTNTDFAFNLGLDREFYWENKKQTHSFTLRPNVNAVFANTGYQQQFNIRVRRQRRPPLNVYTTIEAQRKLQLMSLDFSIPLFFDREKWGCFLSPTFALPFNAVKSTVKYFLPNGNPVPQNIIINNGLPASFSEEISSSFFAEIGFYYKF